MHNQAMRRGGRAGGWAERGGQLGSSLCQCTQGCCAHLAGSGVAGRGGLSGEGETPGPTRGPSQHSPSPLLPDAFLLSPAFACPPAQPAGRATRPGHSGHPTCHHRVGLVSREVAPQGCVGRGQGGLPVLQGAVEQGQRVEALGDKEKSAWGPWGKPYLQPSLRKHSRTVPFSCSFPTPLSVFGRFLCSNSQPPCSLNPRLLAGGL